jgi:uncharacterized protein YndB with AHSA1/START domain
VEQFEERRTVQAGVRTCWEVVTDPSRVPEWLTIATEVDADGDRGAGQVLEGRGGALGVTMALRQTVDLWEPPHRYGWAGDDPIEVRFRCALAPVHPTTTDLHATVEAAVSSSVGARVAVRYLRRQFTRSVDHLAELIEAHRAS